MRVPPPLRRAIVKTPLWPLLRPRRIHVYGVGAPKTGTHSIANLFSEHYRSAHEMEIARTTRLLQRRYQGNQQRLVGAMRERERKWRLECESAHFLAHFADELAGEFPKAKFILTVRKPRSWLRSMIDHCLRYPRSRYRDDQDLKYWILIRDLYFGVPPETYPASEAPLASYNLHMLDGYLSYWARHNRMVLDSVPSDRLLIVRTCELSESIDRIAAFMNVSAATLASKRSHSYKAPQKYELLDEIDEGYVQAKIAKHCSGVMTRLDELDEAVSITG